MTEPPVSRARQVADGIRREITAGRYEPGEKLPSEVRLAEQYKTSRNTVHWGLQKLEREGLVTVSHGRGTFVREPAPDATLVAAEAAHRHATGLDEPVGECPDPDTHAQYEPLAAAVVAALRTTGARLEVRS